MHDKANCRSKYTVKAIPMLMLPLSFLLKPILLYIILPISPQMNNLGITSDTANRDVRRLIELELIEQRVTGRATLYSSGIRDLRQNKLFFVRTRFKSKSQIFLYFPSLFFLFRINMKARAH